ncbi:capsular polysaccharide export protein, LipB/KpsS family [Thiohalorhabdus sp.]|uniref:capsular polysaccharide export protein, LipB/KpsS family n=1 Tax=Thiohalorhabdus sp. TaxID=3094134 RepID=UPI002FC2ED47
MLGWCHPHHWEESPGKGEHHRTAMAHRILLLYNTPKAKRYFETLRDHLSGLDIRVRPLLASPSGPRLSALERARIAEYTMRRKRARLRLPSWRVRLLDRGHRAAAQGHYNWARRQIERLAPDAVGVWGGQAVDAHAARAAADDTGVGRYTFETGLLPQTTTCDPAGVNFDNSVPRDPAFYAAFSGAAPLPESLQQRPGRRPQSAVPLPGDYVFVPFQVHLDSQLLMYSPWIRDMGHMFTAISEAWRGTSLARRGIQLVFKRHPSCPETYPELRAATAREPGVIFAGGNTTEELIRGARGVITLNSTVGIDGLLMDRPVLALGRACYAVPGVADSARSVAEIARWLEAVASDRPPAAGHREAFLRYLARDYCIPDPHKAPGPEHFRAMERRLSDHTRLVPAHPAGEEGAPGGERHAS